MRPLEETFQILRARVEEHAPPSTIVVVSGAQRGDGATYVACGLARAFAAVGHRTLLLDTNATNPAVADELGVSPLPRLSGGAALGARNGEVPQLALAALTGPTMHDGRLRDMLVEMRETFAVTVIDAAAIPESSMAQQLSRLADGVILAVRSGRRPCEADRETVRLLESRLLGIVPTRARGLRRLKHDNVHVLPEVDFPLFNEPARARH